MNIVPSYIRHLINVIYYIVTYIVTYILNPHFEMTTVFPIRGCLKMQDELISNYGPPQRKVVTFNINVVVWHMEGDKVDPCPQVVKLPTSPNELIPSPTPAETIEEPNWNTGHPAFKHFWGENVIIRPFKANLVGSPYPQWWWENRDRQ